MASKIFVVEDYPLMREELVSLLNQFGYLEVCGSCASAEQALEQIPVSGAEYVLVDVSLPGMNGLDLVARLQETYGHIGCLILSGHRSKKYVEKARQLGARGYVSKGDLPALRKALQTMVSGGFYFGHYD